MYQLKKLFMKETKQMNKKAFVEMIVKKAEETLIFKPYNMAPYINLYVHEGSGVSYKGDIPEKIKRKLERYINGRKEELKAAGECEECEKKEKPVEKEKKNEEEKPKKKKEKKKEEPKNKD